MEQLTIAGTVGRDAELRRTQSGDAVLGFSVAVDQGKDRGGNKRDTRWYDASLWGKRAESLQHHIVKGTKLVLVGRPTAREHQGKVYMGISVDQLTFMGGGQRDDRPKPQRASAPSMDLDGDEIPFAPEWR